MFIKPRGLADVQNQVYCGNERLDTVTSAKYLGVTIDDELSWRTYLSHLSTKSRQASSRLWRHRSALSLSARKTWYLAMIQAKLCYGSNSFFPSLSADGMSRIERMSKSGLRAVFGLQNPVPTQPLREKLRVSCIEVLFRRKILVFVYRVINGLASPLFNPYFR